MNDQEETMTTYWVKENEDSIEVVEMEGTRVKSREDNVYEFSDYPPRQNKLDFYPSDLNFTAHRAIMEYMASKNWAREFHLEEVKRAAARVTQAYAYAGKLALESKEKEYKHE